jgi:hypothetical protein
MLFMKKRKDKESKKSKKSNKKKISNISIISIILIISIGIFILFNVFNADNEKCERIENGYCIYNGIPKYLKFQEPVAVDMHEIYNFSKNPFSEYFISEEENDYKSDNLLCADTGEIPKIIWYFEKICEEDIEENCDIHWRNAKICGNFYVVLDYDALGYGYTMYGPYDL